MAATKTTSPALGWRLMTMVTFSDTSCWKWAKYVNPDGYGRLWDGHNGQRMAHRVSYEYFVGPIPDGLEIDHRCRERSCINPYHLEVVSRRENVHRGNGTAGLNARKTSCDKGHPFSGDNLYVGPNGRRVCRTCRRANGTERMRRWRAARAET